MNITEAFYRHPKLGEHTDDLTPGLLLVVRSSKSGRIRKSWLLRITVDGKRRKFGFTCGLAEARRRAAEARDDLSRGVDPSARAKAVLRAQQHASTRARGMTFGEVATQWLPRAPRLLNEKSEAIRVRALEVHLAPIRPLALTAITPTAVVEILATLKPETALRTYGVAKGVFRFASALLEPEGIILRDPTDLAKLRALGWSPRSSRSHKPTPALDWRRAPELLAELESRPDPIARLLAFILGAAARCKAARLAKRRDFDLKTKIWRVPIPDLKIPDTAPRR